MRAKRWLSIGSKIFIPVVLIVPIFISTPYYVFSPGTAEVLEPIVTVPSGQKDEKGSLMLTTVYTLKASNIYYYLYGWLTPHRELVPKEEVEGNLSQADYHKLLEHMMNSSQENAIVSAMKYLGMEVKIKYYGVIVRDILPASKAIGKLQVGDLITKVDQQEILRSEDLLGYLQNKKPGDTVTLELVRDQKPVTLSVDLMALDNPPTVPANTPKRAGIGFSPMTKQKLLNALDVKFTTEDIGGPSAGLMFSLEIVSQLTPGDLTKGYKIAGTGTIDSEGRVGQIGGIQHKIVAADEQGTDIFFAPANVNEGDTNEQVAKAEAARIHSKMKVVPVKTLADAMAYLKQLPPKS